MSLPGRRAVNGPSSAHCRAHRLHWGTPEPGSSWNQEQGVGGFWRCRNCCRLPRAPIFILPPSCDNEREEGLEIAFPRGPEASGRCLEESPPICIRRVPQDPAQHPRPVPVYLRYSVPGAKLTRGICRALVSRPGEMPPVALQESTVGMRPEQAWGFTSSWG